MPQQHIHTRADTWLQRLSSNRLLAAARAGWLDILEGATNWRMWHLMGSAELRQRYTRSRLGQFWLTLSTGIQIAALGLVWSLLWGAPVSELMPYFAISIVFWQFFTGILGDSTTIFTKNGKYFINHRMSFATAISALIYQHLLILLHNAAVIVLVFLFFSKPAGPTVLLALPGLGLAVITGVWLSYVLGILCTRYRDLGQLVNSMLQVAFYVTPVLWKPNFIPEAYREYLLFNPFAVYLSVIRDPILGESLTPEPWLVAAAITLVGFTAALPFIGRYKNRLIYWV